MEANAFFKMTDAPQDQIIHKLRFMLRINPSSILHHNSADVTTFVGSTAFDSSLTELIPVEIYIFRKVVPKEQD